MLNENDKTEANEVRRHLTDQSSRISRIKLQVDAYDLHGDAEKLREVENLLDQARNILFDLV